MKTKKNILDLDFIGRQGSLTKIEEKELSDYFKMWKLSKSTKNKQNTRTLSRPNAVT